MVDLGLFNSLFFDGEDIQWFNKKGVYKIDDNKRAEIELSEFGYSTHYSGYRVTIINKNDGNITSHAFKFSEYINDSNSRDDYHGNIHINTNCLEGRNPTALKDYWYIAVPSDSAIESMANRIFDYINLYK